MTFEVKCGSLDCARTPCHLDNCGDSVPGVAPGVQTKVRALLAGLVALAKHTEDQVKVIVQLATVWEAWHQTKSRGPFQDILDELTPQDFTRVTVLYISRNTRTPDAPGNEPQLSRRQRDSALAAWERAKTLHDARQEEWQETLDQDHKLIYQHAVQRLSKIYEDSTHNIHQKGKRTKQRKKDQVNQCRKAWADNHHRWEPHRSGFQCTACGTRMHQGLTAGILEARLQEDCPQLTIEDLRNQPAMQTDPLPKKLTRAQQIKEILAKQPDQPEPGKHQLTETTGYLKCTKCGVNIHKRVNEAAFTEFTQSNCVNQECTAQHTGHPTHALWQIGERVKCTQCGTQWNLDGNQRLIATQALYKPCKGAATRGSPPLSEFFKKKDTPGSTSQG